MTESTLKLPSFAKINWFLRVFGRRDDNYHEICTAFQSVSLSDTIIFKTGDGLSLTSDDPRIPLTESNLVIKAAKALAERFNIKQGAEIRLEKRIPFPGGLGGGSSNAAVTLLGLSKLWRVDAKREDLLDLAAGIGADVPFFLFGGTALGSGTGSTVIPLDDIAKKLLLIVTPEAEIPTADAYSRLDLPRLTINSLESILQNCRDYAERLESEQLELFNDFEKSVFRMKPGIGRLKARLIDLGAEDALLSGSGSSVFGIFDNDEKRQMALKSLADEQKYDCFAAQTISRKEYRNYLGDCEHLL